MTKLTFSSHRQSKCPEADSYLASEDLDPYISTRRKRKRSTKRESGERERGTHTDTHTDRQVKWGCLDCLETDFPQD